MPSEDPRARLIAENERQRRQWQACDDALADGSPNNSPSLDTPETSPHSAPSPGPADAGQDDDVHPLQVQSVAQSIAHHRHASTRRLIVDALHTAQDFELRKRARKMGLCCVTPTIRLVQPGSVAAALGRCRDRLCPLCATRRGAQASIRTEKLVKSMNAPRFMTLTLAHRDANLDDELSRLHAGLKTLRATKLWSKKVRGGVFGFEVTFNAQRSQWHVHVHAIYDGSYFPQSVLKDVWHKITGDSFIVDVRTVPDRRSAANYIAKYVAKPVEVERWPESAVREYAAAMKGRRLLQTFGSAHKAVIDDDDDDADDRTSKHGCYAGQLIDLSDAGCPHSRRVRSILARMSFDTATAMHEQYDPTGVNGPPDAAEVALAMTVVRAIGETLGMGTTESKEHVHNAVQRMLQPPDPEPPPREERESSGVSPYVQPSELFDAPAAESGTPR